MTDTPTLFAVAAIDLLLRAWEFGGPGEDSLEEIAESIRDGIAKDGLAVVVERQLEFERGELEEDEEEPEPLSAALRAALEANHE